LLQLQERPKSTKLSFSIIWKIREHKFFLFEKTVCAWIDSLPPAPFYTENLVCKSHSDWLLLLCNKEMFLGSFFLNFQLQRLAIFFNYLTRLEIWYKLLTCWDLRIMNYILFPNLT
jgi:hypothetical protein